MSTDYIKNDLKGKLNEKRYEHSLRTAETAWKMAIYYCSDEEKAYLAGLIHDVGKSLAISRQEELLNSFGYDEDFLKYKQILHAPCGRILAKTDYQIQDMDILNAIEYHTYARENMSLLEKIIYVADSIEPERSYPGVDEIRKYAFENLDYAVFLCLKRTVEKKNRQKKPIYEGTLVAYEYYKNLF